MQQKESEAVPAGNGSVPQQEEFGSGPTLADIYRLFEERFDRQQKVMDSSFDKQQKKWTAFSTEWTVSIDGTESWTRFRMRQE